MNLKNSISMNLKSSFPMNLKKSIQRPYLLSKLLVCPFCELEPCLLKFLVALLYRLEFFVLSPPPSPDTSRVRQHFLLQNLTVGISIGKLTKNSIIAFTLCTRLFFVVLVLSSSFRNFRFLLVLEYNMLFLNAAWNYE